MTLIALVLALVLGACQGETPLPDCEWCGAPEAPKSLGWDLVIAGPDEPGERLVLEGTVFQRDGKTPAPGVLVYAYHTSSNGEYAKKGGETGNGRRHGHLRGWLRTGADGRYRIRTIRPGAYPSRKEPAHIHLTLTPPGGEEDWVDSVMFADDPLLGEGGGSGVITVVRGDDGVWRGRRDLVIGRR